MNDTRVIRDRQAAATRDLDNAAGDLPLVAGQSVLAVTYEYLAGNYPKVPNAFYAVHLTEIDGVEQEGTIATYVQPAALRIWPVFAYNLGSSIPAQGLTIICHYVGGRLAFRYDGS